MLSRSNRLYSLDLYLRSTSPYSSLRNCSFYPHLVAWHPFSLLQYPIIIIVIIFLCLCFHCAPLVSPILPRISLLFFRKEERERAMPYTTGCYRRSERSCYSVKPWVQRIGRMDETRQTVLGNNSLCYCYFVDSLGVYVKSALYEDAFSSLLIWLSSFLPS